MNISTSAQHLDRSLTERSNQNKLDIADANSQLENMLVNKDTAEFREAINPEHSLYAVTLTPYKDDIITKRLTYNKSDCSKYIENLITELLHLFHKNCQNNYSRYKSKKTKFFASVEFENKQHSNSVTPHAHACFAVHPEYQDIFKALLITHPKSKDKSAEEKEAKTVDFRLFKNQKLAKALEAKVASLHITSLEPKDFFKWASYCFKQETHSLQLKQRR